MLIDEIKKGESETLTKGKNMKKQAEMTVCSEVELSVTPAERHIQAAREAAELLTTDKSRIEISAAGKFLSTRFPMKRARQIDIVDRIMHTFSMDMEDYETQAVYFPKSAAERERDQRKLERAKERRRELHEMKRKGNS